MALFAFVATSLAQDNVCEDTFFRVARNPDDCRRFFICMISRRVDFICDAGDIFDEESLSCRRGNPETCEFINPQIPGNECENDFFRVSPHPDPRRCADFFVCLNYNLIEFRCDPEYIFSEFAQRCIPGDQRTCEEAGAVPYKQLMTSL